MIMQVFILFRNFISLIKIIYFQMSFNCLLFLFLNVLFYFSNLQFIKLILILLIWYHFISFPVKTIAVFSYFFN